MFTTFSSSFPERAISIGFRTSITKVFGDPSSEVVSVERRVCKFDLLTWLIVVAKSRVCVNLSDCNVRVLIGSSIFVRI